ncbi:hypothetical protein CXB51_008551 [Gossypium anomalum]|uniref:VDE lipocalin domain-containing protein n=1 Tax=Gossypium anomalum TaxID=47600 RepID=A0A8J5YVM9_9ROSI|nr:hypothetical protein CXB51_008551 [Gossypium anomalum]
MSLVLEPLPPPLSKSKTGAPLKRCFTSNRTALPPPNHRFRASRFPLHPTSSSRPTVIVVLKTEKEKNVVTEQKDPPIRIVAVVDQGSVSPLKCTPWEEVMMHTAKRLKWVDEGYEMVVFTDNIHQSNDQIAMDLQKELACVDILLVVAVTNQDSVKWIGTNSRNIPNVICFDSDPGLVNKLGGSYVHSETKGSIFDKLVGISQLKKTDETKEPVPILKNLRSKGFSTLNCTVKNCGPQILDCLMDPNYRKALQCLNKCNPVDQKNNCLDAKIPEKPYVQPMLKFRGKDLCHETTEDLFVGWLGSLDWSWRVVTGQNPAYDQFPCQYQLFYRGKAKGSFWYEPVFQVKTLEGELVWRRRKYRVKRANVPGIFYFSVWDNGVVSNEYWTIVDVSEDFSWGLFHYHGAARVAGQSYSGAVLVSPDGTYPKHTQSNRLSSTLEKCGIKEWELYTVDNCAC